MVLSNRMALTKTIKLFSHKSVNFFSTIKGSLQTVARAETGELRGGALYRGILSEILFGKGTTNSGREQGNSEKNSENLQSGENVRFSISPEVDAEYMAAVESGDMEKAGAMVKAAFKARFPWVSALIPLTLSKKNFRKHLSTSKYCCILAALLSTE